MKQLLLFVLSDSLGETGERLIKASLSQFSVENYEIKRFPQVHSMDYLNIILEEAREKKVIVVYTLVKEEMVRRLEAFSQETKLPCVDLLSGLLQALSQTLGEPPSREAGYIRKLNEAYFKRVEAMEFAVKYDDGKDPQSLSKADLVILGISRTSKTPLSLYLANYNIKVVNIPIVANVMPPKEIYDLPAKRVIGLTNSPEKLNQIRESRLRALGLPTGASYSDLNKILEEIEYAEAIMKRIGCLIIDVSDKAIEETAELILIHLKRCGVKV